MQKIEWQTEPHIKKLPISPSCFISLPHVYKCIHTNTWLCFKSKYHVYHKVSREVLGERCGPSLSWPNPTPRPPTPAPSPGDAERRPSLLTPLAVPYSTPICPPRCPSIAHVTCPQRLLIKRDRPTPTRVWMSETLFGAISLKAFWF